MSFFLAQSIVYLKFRVNFSVSLTSNDAVFVIVILKQHGFA
jgi:hypothetical protein